MLPPAATVTTSPHHLAAPMPSAAAALPATPRIDADRQPVVTPAEKLLRGAARLWRGKPDKGLQVRMFRRHITSHTAPAAAEIRIAAASYFHLWVNGEYITRGPIFHQPGPLPVHTLDITPHWRVGDNVVAALVYCPGFPTHQVPTGDPGLWAAIGVLDAAGEQAWTVTDQHWQVSDRTGWQPLAVRHGYALGAVEVLDATAHPWGWQEPGYDDSDWPQAEVLSSGDQPVVVDLPTLVHDWAAVKHCIGSFAVESDAAPLEPGQACEVLGEWLQEEPWHPIATDHPNAACWDAERGTLEVKRLTPDHGIAVVLDLEAEQVGHLCWDLESDSDGLVEIGWSEVTQDGRPAVTHKGTTYVDRLLAKPGKQRWEALQFSGLRYVTLIFRVFTGSVRLTNLGVRTSTSVPQIDATFNSSEPRLDSVFSLCHRTLRIGTQETIIDCPSREQAPYLGDGNLVGRWLAELGGDSRHWRYLIQLGFESQAHDGLLRDAPLMPMRRSLIDYVLLTVMGLRDYWRFTGDAEFTRGHLEGARKALGYFDRRLLDDGLLAASEIAGIRLSIAWDIAGQPRSTESLDPHVFIDHAGGLGHNLGDAGIERRGRSAALNALYALACDAIAELEDRFAESDRAASRRAVAERIRKAATAAYWDVQQGVFIDAIDESNRPFSQVSEQTNVLAIMAGFGTPVTPQELLTRVMLPDPAVARCGPYFYGYLLPLMAHLGMHSRALDLIREKWGRMLDAGATSLWETFAGDRMDTWCHPWAAAPGRFMLRDVLGIQVDSMQHSHITLRPRYDLLKTAAGKLPIAAGLIEMQWETHGGKVQLSGKVPPGCSALLHPCGGGEPMRVASTWRTQYLAPTASQNL